MPDRVAVKLAEMLWEMPAADITYVTDMGKFVLSYSPSRVGCLSGWSLASTNPKIEQEYIDQLVRHAESDYWAQMSGSNLDYVVLRDVSLSLEIEDVVESWLRYHMDPRHPYISYLAARDGTLASVAYCKQKLTLIRLDPSKSDCPPLLMRVDVKEVRLRTTGDLCEVWVTGADSPYLMTAADGADLKRAMGVSGNQVEGLATSPRYSRKLGLRSPNDVDHRK